MSARLGIVLQTAGPCSWAAQHCGAEPAESSRCCVTCPSSCKLAPSPPAWRALSYPDPGRVHSAGLPSLCRVTLLSLPWRLAPDAVLTAASLHQAYLWDSYQRVQQQLLKRQPLADSPMVPTIHAGHRPLSRAQSSPATATVSLPAQDTASKTLSLPVQEQPAKPHFTTGTARPLCGALAAGAAAEAGDKSWKGGGDAQGHLSISPGHSQAHKCLGVLWLAAKRAEQAMRVPFSLCEVAFPKQDLPIWPLGCHPGLAMLARFSSLTYPRQDLLQACWDRGSHALREMFQSNQLQAFRVSASPRKGAELGSAPSRPGCPVQSQDSSSPCALQGWFMTR